MITLSKVMMKMSKPSKRGYVPFNGAYELWMGTFTLLGESEHADLRRPRHSRTQPNTRTPSGVRFAGGERRRHIVLYDKFAKSAAYR